ncbi:hypothetical protein AOL_s00188g226 [Orbilia oligospora ATCC 24927]|uniref:Uncharacterized protein n=2 Tax=Orbilia oligospora TaxID=2813651 RepID=G1XQL4_ARTOA|nr:hypothetical protein AOL_s00188g226 [Orbilia oligospora ATCC 24927]EGX44558.1 hypothetical protein AOL_s00188g226 [Orbilia oligospora ATCC 24927]KAF3280529.1 hypothetical protein TWF970_002750 [Orbilia oligospora]
MDLSVGTVTFHPNNKPPSRTANLDLIPTLTTNLDLAPTRTANLDLVPTLTANLDLAPTLTATLAPTLTPKWDPKTDADKKLSDTISKLSGSTADCFITYEEPSGEVKTKFVLNSPGINDLQAYVLMGMQFPSDNDTFETKMPESYFDIVSEIDGTIWRRTRDLFVKISKSCQTFHDERLPKILNAASTTREYAKSAIRDLSQAKVINLRENLLIILDEKYRTTPPDLDYKDAEATINQTLKKLGRSAESSKADIADIKTGLDAFKTNTGRLKEGVLDLAASYDKKHTLSDGSQVNISEMADSKHADAVKDLIKAQEAENEQSKDMVFWKFISYAFAKSDSEAKKIISGGAYLISDYELNHSVKEARAQVSGLDAKEKAVAELVFYVEALETQFKTIEKSMDKAISAMAHLYNLFDRQSGYFNGLVDNFSYIQSNLDEPSYKARAGGIIDGVDQTISGLGELKRSAEEFYKTHTEEAAEYEKFKIWE